MVVKVEIVTSNKQIKGVQIGDLVKRKACGNIFVIVQDPECSLKLISITSHKTFQVSSKMIVDFINKGDYIYYPQTEYKLQLVRL